MSPEAGSRGDLTQIRGFNPNRPQSTVVLWKKQGQQAEIKKVMASMTKGYLVFVPDRMMRKSDLLLEQHMTILYLEDIKRSRAELTGANGELSTVCAGNVVQLEKRRSWWPNVERCLKFPLPLRKLKDYSPSSSWLPEHSSQWLECMHDRRP
jgi:hypothetical protein